MQSRVSVLSHVVDHAGLKKAIGEVLAEQGYGLHAVLTLSHLLALLEQEGRIDGRQRAEVLSALK